MENQNNENIESIIEPVVEIENIENIEEIEEIQKKKRGRPRLTEAELKFREDRKVRRQKLTDFEKQQKIQSNIKYSQYMNRFKLSTAREIMKMPVNPKGGRPKTLTEEKRKENKKIYNANYHEKKKLFLQIYEKNKDLEEVKNKFINL